MLFTQKAYVEIILKLHIAVRKNSVLENDLPASHASMCVRIFMGFLATLHCLMILLEQLGEIAINFIPESVLQEWFEMYFTHALHDAEFVVSSSNPFLMIALQQWRECRERFIVSVPAFCRGN